MKTTWIKALIFGSLPLILAQCNSLKHDVQEVNKRNALIAQEPKGDYLVARRYHVPSTRFWGYVRRPGQTWRTAELIIMDESKCLNPDRLPEYAQDKRYGYDNNYEYRVYGKFTGKYAYDPNSNLKIRVFQPTKFVESNRQPGWLFAPSEKFDSKAVTIRPAVMPTPEQLSDPKYL